MNLHDINDHNSLTLEFKDQTQITCTIEQDPIYGNYVCIRVKDSDALDPEFINFGASDDKYNNSSEVLEAINACESANELEALISSAKFDTHYDLQNGLIEITTEHEEEGIYKYPLILRLDDFHEDGLNPDNLSNEDSTTTTTLELTKEQYWGFNSWVNTSMTPEQVIEKLKEMGLSPVEG